MVRYKQAGAGDFGFIYMLLYYLELVHNDNTLCWSKIRPFVGSDLQYYSSDVFFNQRAKELTE